MTGLFTDLYELTMAQAYLAEGMEDTAVFEVLFRKMPARRPYLVAAGLDDVLTLLERWRITDDDVEYLRSGGRFSEAFLARLAGMRFTGDVDAVPEGTLVFSHEPMLRVRAPIAEAQILETAVLNELHFQTLAATKASRCVEAAAGRTVVEFGARRAHGREAALRVARTSWIAGAAGTSNVEAGKAYSIPVFGTMAHSYVQAHDDEAAAFAAFVREFPATTLLVDTYDTTSGVEAVIDLARRLGDDFAVRAIRLDSGDIATLARSSRATLDAAGLQGVGIFASGNLDEDAVAALVRGGAPIDGFGVGTRLSVVEDGPSVDMAYKLVEYAGRPRLKLSTSKAIHPGAKQVFRTIDDGVMRHDVIGRADETGAGVPLLRPVMRAGRRIEAGARTLDDARRHAVEALATRPPSLVTLDAPETPYPVRFSESLERLRAELGR